MAFIDQVLHPRCLPFPQYRREAFEPGEEGHNLVEFGQAQPAEPAESEEIGQRPDMSRQAAGKQQENQQQYKVVVNHEEQYSIWPAERENALGWVDAGKSGSKDECLAWIKEVWTDMRPLSLRKQMDKLSIN